MLTKPRLMLTVLALFFSSSILYAEGKMDAEEKVDWYSVEYIIFENNPLSNRALEPWVKEPFLMPMDAMALDSLSEDEAFSPLAINQQQLHGVLNRLTKLSSYTPIAHGGWIQPLDEKSNKQAIQILQQAGTIQLEGTLTFHRGRYLHLDVDLQLSEMIPTHFNDAYIASAALQPSTVYRLKDTRRIKTSNSHYFDHPRFGVLAIVEKIDSPVAPVPTTDITDAPTELEAIDIPSPNAAEN